MSLEFTAHNIVLDNGNHTISDSQNPISEHPWFKSAKRVLETTFPGDKSSYRIADLGCLEGGYAVEFARMGFQVLGMEVRESNLLACNFVKENVNLPNLTFVKDDVWNLEEYGTFDAIFCCGLLYHLDQPKKFMEMLSRLSRKIMVIQTHFSTEGEHNPKFILSDITTNEGLQGRWYTEYMSDADFANRENLKWTSWDNYKSFWLKREDLLQTIQEVGFDFVFEQFDSLGNDIKASIEKGYYFSDNRGTFVGIKTSVNKF